jgi:hypothetical protein
VDLCGRHPGGVSGSIIVVIVSRLGIISTATTLSDFFIHIYYILSIQTQRLESYWLHFTVSPSLNIDPTDFVHVYFIHFVQVKLPKEQ